jgi:hypothetical protein
MQKFINITAVSTAQMWWWHLTLKESKYARLIME